MVVVEEGAAGTVGDDEADGQRLVSQQVAETVDGRGLHLEVGHPEFGVWNSEFGEFFVEVVYRRMEPYGAPLGAVEAWGGGGDASVHVGGYLVEQQWASSYAVGTSQTLVELHVLQECFLHRCPLFTARCPLFVVVHQAVEADGIGGGDVAAAVDVGLQRAAGADAYYLQVPVTVFLPFPVLHSQGGIEFGHYDVDVVAPHAGAEGGESGAVIEAREGVDFAVVRLVFDAFKDVFEHVDPLGVTNEQHLVGQGAAGKTYVVEAAVGGKH